MYLLAFTATAAFTEPIVLNGKMVPQLVGAPLSALRVTTTGGDPVPFQIDEITGKGEYVCPDGERPNTNEGNGVLDPQDEIVFLWEDADNGKGVGASQVSDVKGVRVEVFHGEEKRTVIISADSSLPMSPVHYIDYDYSIQVLKTPYYYAQFGKNRFHFIHAGIKDFATGNYMDITNELRIEIKLKTLWGLLPITYSENSIVCLVKRYKTGPVRLIRRGDFHMNLGFGVQGSRAAVNQICYPSIVKVPVDVHIPFRFKTLFTEAYIEMTPVVRSDALKFSYHVPSYHILFPLSSELLVDTLTRVNPNNRFALLDNGTIGYGWLLRDDMPDSLTGGSGYVFRKPSRRTGFADCGYRLGVTDVPKGFYQITNWVLLCRSSVGELNQDFQYLQEPAILRVNGLHDERNQITRGPHPDLSR